MLNLCVILHVSAIHSVVIRCSLLTFAVTVFFRCLGCTSEGLRTRMHTHMRAHAHRPNPHHPVPEKIAAQPTKSQS